MIYIRKSDARGKTHIDWLQSLHTFSFANYYDENFMGIGALRVINEDTVQPGFGFGKHPHDNMEIISYVVQGELAHEDSMGNGSVIKPGEIQRMSAGTGVMHGEFNRSKTEIVHFLQIWIIPDTKNLTPGYQQVTIQKEMNQLVLIGARDAHPHAITIHQDIYLYAAFLTANHTLNYPVKENRLLWLQLIKGQVTINDQVLTAGDGAAIRDEALKIRGITDAEFLLFDLASA